MERLYYTYLSRTARYRCITMEINSSMNPHESIKLAKQAQRLSNLKAIPGNWFCFFVSLTVGLAFGFMCNQQSLFSLISVTAFPLIIYIQKRNTGLWPFGFAPFIRPVDSFYSKSIFWKKMKVNLAVQLISSMVVLFFFVSFVDILEFRDEGFWWAPIASGTIVGVAIFTILLSSNNYYRNKYSVANNE